MTDDAEVLVVGGGPAGAATAVHLADRGHEVVVCERARFPRDKTCGDGLTPRAVRELERMGLGAHSFAGQPVVGLRLRIRDQTVELPFPSGRGWPEHGLVVRRSVLDDLVLGRAAASGATVLHGTTAVRPFLEDGVVRGVVATDGHGQRTLRARWVVCAEGSTGTLTRALGRTRQPGYPMAIGLRQYVRSDAAPTEWFDVFLDVIPGRALAGYGWAFPMADGSINLGTGGLASRMPPRLRAIQATFVERVGRDLGGGDVVRLNGAARGGRLPLGDCVWPLHGPGYVLVGDAAGRVNPSTGEGIAYAYETGRLAARHLDRALRTPGTVSVPEYTQEVAETYAPYYRLARGVLYTLGVPAVRYGAMAAMLRSRQVRCLTTTLATNLDSPDGTSLDERLFRGLTWLAGTLP